MLDNLPDFMVRAVIGGMSIAVIAGPLGSFVLWRRMAYFGAALSHSALLGVALGLALGLPTTLGVFVVSGAVAGLLVVWQRDERLARDTLLGILAHGSLALGMVVIAQLEGLRTDLLGLLFGDILAVAPGDLYAIVAGGAAVLAILAGIWNRLLLLTLHRELAQAEGTPAMLIELVFMLLIAAVVALAMKLVGILLITSLLIIPPAVARPWARTPEVMAVAAIGIGCLAVGLGLWGSWTWNLPAGPAIVLTATALFALTRIVPRYASVT